MFNKIKRIIVIVILVVALAATSASFILANQNKQLKRSNADLTSNIELLQNNLNNIKEAAKARENKYNEIQKEAQELNKKIEELKDAKSLEWLDSVIPEPVDNTIPY